MIIQQEIQKMLKEVGLEKLAEKSQFSDFDNWTKLSSKSDAPQTQTFIEITTTTVSEIEQRGKNGELGRNFK